MLKTKKRTLFSFSNETEKQVDNFRDMFGIIKRSWIRDRTVETNHPRYDLNNFKRYVRFIYIAYIDIYGENFLVIRYIDMVDVKMVDA